ncbi:hypothetical protein ENU1_158100 [Entamoeba nuttalli P19]|uniref:Uncharacterized protein n=1 Tax=Entamoeba nuttalli (strain P19) TaxID=1076696 RepID=K2GY14_ENTNP|nr:hypothetical protein ENU1_158100 [Entamoeba nuttalli P19]EKE38667.1 hypothetical protein ENU1_158100 [Entamoeba nuttalli P19]|eukprot:XP_008858999.1 hypothetical protein ENU1_158100 [Entamoeba nuttalli P19]
MGDSDTLIILILCIFIPPLAIWWKTREFDTDFIICLLLWLICCGIGGVIYAFIKCFA